MDFSGLSQEDVQSILDSISDPSKLRDLQDQLEEAQKLRETHTPDTINSGRLLIPNIAGTIGGFLDRYQGSKDEAAAKAERDALYARQAKSAGAFWRALQGDPTGFSVPGQAKVYDPSADNSGNANI